ncbi:unnamed protein product [marine sediment metagenome]|uniref:Uncharacterized protein n=1 Tax=marine sediment metagenome TaxID=412755 RepID=X1SHB6_9ZZZZ
MSRYETNEVRKCSFCTGKYAVSNYDIGGGRYKSKKGLECNAEARKVKLKNYIKQVRVISEEKVRETLEGAVTALKLAAPEEGKE